MSGIITNKTEELKKENEVVKILIAMTKDRIGTDFDINKVEKSITEIFKELRKETTEKIIEGKDFKTKNCKCGKKMKIKEKVKKKVRGLVDYEIGRRSFHCPDCGIYEKPLDKKINCSGGFTKEIKEAIVLPGQRIPFEEASYFLEKLLGVEVSQETIQELTEKTGEKIFEDEKKGIQKCVTTDGHINSELVSNKEIIDETVYLQMDGSMVQTREEGWKEVRNGVIFKSKDNAKIDKHHKSILKKKYFSVFNEDQNSLELFKNRITHVAYEQKFQQYKR